MQDYKYRDSMIPKPKQDFHITKPPHFKDLKRPTGRTANLWKTIFQARSTISTLYSKNRTRNNA